MHRGNSECPVETATLVYKGRAAGTYFSSTGGGSNHLCLVEDPSYYEGTPQVDEEYAAYVYGSQYKDTVSSGVYLHRDIPCAVCQTIRQSQVLTVPGKHSCPDDTWTLEYNGYIMTEHGNHYRSTFECIDKEMEVVPDVRQSYYSATFYHATVNCDHLSELCPLYDSIKPLTCAVCSK